MKIAIIVVVALVGVIALVTIAGMFMPRQHVATSEITLKHPADSVWTALRRVSAAAANDIKVDVVEDAPPHRFTTKVVEEKGAPFGGTWTHVLAPSAGGTTVTITENGWIGPPPFRVIATLMGLHRGMDAVLASTAKELGESATPTHR